MVFRLKYKEKYLQLGDCLKAHGSCRMLSLLVCLGCHVESLVLLLKDHSFIRLVPHPYDVI